MKIVALAKSWRNGGICFAGKDVSTGEWIRPVTRAGAIPKTITQHIKLLDVVEINITERCPNLHQQENYNFSGDEWHKVEKYNKAQLNTFLDNPLNIWDHSGKMGADRVLLSDIKKFKISNSLLLVSTTYAKIYFNNYDKMCCEFVYNSITYNLRITDEEANQKLLNGQVLADPYLCISLAGAGWVNQYTGREECFKLIAGVII